MSPEVLDESLYSLNFEVFKQSDMYSFALVLWETARRTTAYGRAGGAGGWDSGCVEVVGVVVVGWD